MTIKQYGGIFGRNPDFKSLTLSGGSSLSHYSEGTWTPDPQDTSGNSGSASSAKGHYTRVGNLVFATFELINIDTTGLTAADDFRIYGLPYTAASLDGTQFFSSSARMQNITFSGTPSLLIYDGTDYIRILETTSGSGSDYVVVSEIASGSADIYGTITYMAE